MLNSFFKKPASKQFVRYVLPMYLSLVILGLLAYITESGVDSSGMFGGLAILGHYLIWIVVILIVTVVLSIILTIKNIKKNYNDNSESDYETVTIIILKTLLVYMIVIQLINGIFSLFINSFSINFVVGIIIEIILAPVIIPIAKYFNKDNYVSRQAVKDFYLLLTVITIIFYLFFRVFAIIFNYGILNFIDIYIFFVFVIPTLIIGLKNKAKSAKSIDIKKEIFIVVALLLVLLAIIIGKLIDKVEKNDIGKSDYTIMKTTVHI